MKKADQLGDDELWYLVQDGAVGILKFSEDGNFTQESLKDFRELNGVEPWDELESILSTGRGSWIFADLVQEYRLRFLGVPRIDTSNSILRMNNQKQSPEPANEQQTPEIALNDLSELLKSLKTPKGRGRPTRKGKAAHVRKTIRFTTQEIEELEQRRRPGESWAEMIRRILFEP